MAKKAANRKGGKKRTLRKRRKKRRPIKIKVTAYVMSAVFVVLAALAALIAKPYIKERHIVDKGAYVPSGYYCYGIDISRYQTDIEWDKVKVLTDAHGRTTNSVNLAKDIRNISYVFIKATEGTSLRDRHFKKHWNDAGRRGVRRGAYHFFRSSKDAENQARHFIRTVGDLSADDLPPVLDIETIHKGCSHKTLNDKALIWLKAVEKHYGRKPIVYSSASFINNIICEEIKDNYPIWVAHYGAK
jgi:lysozyme